MLRYIQFKPDIQRLPPLAVIFFAFFFVLVLNRVNILAVSMTCLSSTYLSINVLNVCCTSLVCHFSEISTWRDVGQGIRFGRIRRWLKWSLAARSRFASWTVGWLVSLLSDWLVGGDGVLMTSVMYWSRNAAWVFRQCYTARKRYQLAQVAHTFKTHHSVVGSCQGNKLQISEHCAASSITQWICF